MNSRARNLRCRKAPCAQGMTAQTPASARVKTKVRMKKNDTARCADLHTHREQPVAALVVSQPSPHLGGRRCCRLHRSACVGVCEHLDAGIDRRGAAKAREHKQARRPTQRVCRRPRRQGGDEVLPHDDRERDVFVRRFQQGQQLDSGNPPQRRVTTPKPRKAHTHARAVRTLAARRETAARQGRHTRARWPGTTPRWPGHRVRTCGTITAGVDFSAHTAHTHRHHAPVHCADAQ